MATKENVLKLLSDSGSVEKRKSGKGHTCFLLPNGIVYSVPVSAHDHRVWDNSMSRLKQMLGEYLPEQYKPKNKRSNVSPRPTKVKKTNHHKREAFSSLTPIIAPVKTVAQQLIEAGLAEAPVPVEVRRQSIRSSYQHRVYQREEVEEQNLTTDLHGSESSEPQPLMKEPPLRWHDVKLPARPKTSRLKENRICRVASEEIKAEANRILNDPSLTPAQRDQAYREFMRNPQIKTKMEVTEIPMPARRTAPVPMMKVTLPTEPQKPMEDPAQKELNDAQARLATIDQEIADADTQSMEFMKLSDTLKNVKKALEGLVEFHAKRAELYRSGVLKKEEPVTPAPQQRAVPAIITSKMVAEECADLLDRDGKGVDSKVIWQRFMENYPHIEQAVEKKTISQRLAFLKNDNIIESIDFGIYRFTKQGQERFRPKKQAANGHAADAATANTPQQSQMTH